MYRDRPRVGPFMCLRGKSKFMLNPVTALVSRPKAPDFEPKWTVLSQTVGFAAHNRRPHSPGDGGLNLCVRRSRIAPRFASKSPICTACGLPDTVRVCGSSVRAWDAVLQLLFGWLRFGVVHARCVRRAWMDWRRRGAGDDPQGTASAALSLAHAGGCRGMKIREGEYPYSKRQMQSDPLPDPGPATQTGPEPREMTSCCISLKRASSGPAIVTNIYWHHAWLVGGGVRAGLASRIRFHFSA